MRGGERHCIVLLFLFILPWEASHYVFREISCNKKFEIQYEKYIQLQLFVMDEWIIKLLDLLLHVYLQKNY